MKDQRMKKISSVLAAAGLFAAVNSQAQFASSVVSYTQGTGVAPGYNNPSAALGAPTAYNGYQNTDPFNPAYLPGDIVGVGAGGSLTLQFNQPILNSPSNPFGLDFIVFGHAGFNITNGDYSGGGITDGTFFTGGTSMVQVWVSANGSTFYQLNPAMTPQVDGLYPTDSTGNPFLPVNPALTAADFAGQNLAGIRALYNGSDGGAGFSLSWAGVPLAEVKYVQFDVVSGTAYIDAVSVVPEPGSVSLAILAGAALFYRKNFCRA